MHKAKNISTEKTIARYQTYLFETGTPLPETDNTFDFAVTFYDIGPPNIGDLFAIKKSKTGTNSTEVHILSAANKYQSYLFEMGTPLPETDDTFDFLLAENKDLFAIKKSKTGTNSTEVHILSAASKYQSYILPETGTPLPETDNTFDFAIDNERNIYAIKKSKTRTGHIAVIILYAVDNYQSLFWVETALPETDDTFDFAIDNEHNLFAIKKNKTGTNSTEVHILSAVNKYQSYILETGTVLPETDDTFDFAIDIYSNLYAIKKSKTRTNSTEIHILNGYEIHSGECKSTSASIPK